MEDSRAAVQMVSRYVEKGYSVSVVKGEDVPRLNEYVEGSTNVVTSINAGPGISVDNTDPSRPVVKMRTDCPANNVLVWDGSNWTCVDKTSMAGGGGRYNTITDAVYLGDDVTADYFDAFGICADLDTLGHNDWRLPSAAELIYACNEFISCSSVYVWTNVVTYDDPIAINWGNRAIDNSRETNSQRIICVRP